MTLIRPSSIGLHAVSRASVRSHAIRSRTPIHPIVVIRTPTTIIRTYASHKTAVSSKSKSTPPEPKVTSSAKDALTPIEQTGAYTLDPINPPRSTRPPDLALPERTKDEQVFWYWFKIGRAYGTFYKEGVKAVWYNIKAARSLKANILGNGEDKGKAGTGRGAKSINDAAIRGLMNRSEWQLIARNRHDQGKLPMFGVLVLLFGEWLPLIVPFIPGAVPGTCRIPKQVRGMRMKAEERRRVSFRQGVPEPGEEQRVDDRAVVEGRPVAEVKTEWPMAGQEEYVKAVVGKLQDHQLLHLSTSLGLHSSVWDRVQLAPPSFLLRRAVARHLQYVAVDDLLLVKHGRDQVVKKLKSEEVLDALQERGVDVLGRDDGVLGETMQEWLERQNEDHGRGGAMMKMLFRRPNAWKTKSEK